MALVPQHNIFPVKGREAKEYLLRQGCLVGSEMITLPNHLKMVPISASGITYAVMHNRADVFHMQHYHLMNRWRIVVPPPYQVTLLELATSYGINSLWNADVFGSYETMLQIIGSISIQRNGAIAILKRLSDHTGHPYDLENVKVALTEDIAKTERL